MKLNYDIASLAFEDIREHYGTGRSYLISDGVRGKKYGYRSGVQTKIGDIEEFEWEALAVKLIERDGEQTLQENLLDWIKNQCPWLHTQRERKHYALCLHVSRIFDNEEWVDYIPFHKEYRPEKLNDERK